MQNKESKTIFLLQLGLVIAVILAFVGWVLNIISIVSMATADNMQVSAMFIARCVGVLFAPLGAILGWF